MPARGFTWASERLWREFGEEVTHTNVMMKPCSPLERYVADEGHGGEMLLVLRNQCGMSWKPMDLPLHSGYHRHVMLFFSGDRNNIDEVSIPRS